jgi:prevent-host-death family protein
MTKINMHEAKTKLSQLVEKAEAGEEVIIARSGKPVARLSPVRPGKATRKLGLLDRKGFKIPEDFNNPLPAAIAGAFEGSK